MQYIRVMDAQIMGAQYLLVLSEELSFWHLDFRGASSIFGGSVHSCVKLCETK